MTPSFLRFWGKAHADAPVDQPGYHLLAYHSLDVAAVGHELLKSDAALCQRLASVSGLSSGTLLAVITFLLALHDVGKFGDGFQSLRPDIVASLQGPGRSAPYNEHHSDLGYRYYRERLLSKLPLGDPRLPAELDAWVAAVTGHHGQPPRDSGGEPIIYQFPKAVDQAVREFVSQASQITLRDSVEIQQALAHADEQALVRASWLVAGLAVAVDWIGSNRVWFPYEAEPIRLDMYWHERALPQARRAVRESGIVTHERAGTERLQALFPHCARATPLQAQAESLPLASGPQLFVLEENTGSGKTEAAIMLAHRLMRAGLGSGIYLALPTMATANAMHQRIEAMYRRLFLEEEEPSLVLAHSASRLAEALQRAPRDTARRSEATTETATADCATWLNDNRKKALLASVGVGTIDQALLAVLPVRHQSLRLLGLARNVLIVDEVHACDSYMNRLLRRLLEFHAALGGSAILLSATLPLQERRHFVAAFRRGLGEDPAELSSEAFPLLTHTARSCASETPVAARPESSREVAVDLAHDVAAIDYAIHAALSSGQCVCWLRNTVHDAREAFERWRVRLDAERITLLHARFALGDRLTIERNVLAAFGPQSDAVSRAGRLVIATQVVEQSLDLDFDFMVTDLAPIDLIVQRAGRCRRHRRSEAGDIVSGSDARDGRALIVFAPRLDDPPSVNWFSRVFPRASAVYPDHGRLWLTAQWLTAHGGFTVPADTRELVEAVYGPEAERGIPEALQSLTERALGNAHARSALAYQNALRLEEGYDCLASASDHWYDDIHTPTRLGDPTTTIRLVRCSGEGDLLPWCTPDAVPRAFQWQLSQVRVRQRLVAGAVSDVDGALAKAKGVMPDEGRYVVVVVLRESADGWRGEAVDAIGKPVTLAYSRDTGLVIQRQGDGR